ncbi:ABC transporter ATP-binding protein [Mycoplasma todarodis]|uniref:ABC transporter ATP-binding protein n=1 Tax=Mycoplasma todarodis TaxID=1937191 RepID=A0A4R0XS87_9MOLU|nr:ABC transporter ATP-binding protein [Mycoplasma todarodis]TCG10557.1 ABC transporter ATP-binding protein [Mycoplasma todarodis]
MFNNNKDKEKQEKVVDKKLNSPTKVAKTKKTKKSKQKKNSKAAFKRIKGPIGKKSPIIKVNKVTKEYGELKALDNISFELMPGERVGLIGGNGAGKTTISEIIVGLNQGTKGTIEYGFDYKEQPQEKIGMQFQDSNYPSGLTIKDIIKFAINVHKIKITNEELTNLLKIFQMTDFYNRPSRSLSGGQRQKLNILLSVLHKPKLVIFDELSTGLDVLARDEIIKFSDTLLRQNEISAILISHHTEEIERICDKVIVLDHGKVMDRASIADIQRDHGSLEAFMKKIIKAGNQTQNTLELTLDVEASKKLSLQKLKKKVKMPTKEKTSKTPAKKKEPKKATKKTNAKKGKGDK